MEIKAAKKSELGDDRSEEALSLRDDVEQRNLGIRLMLFSLSLSGRRKKMAQNQKRHSRP